MPLRVFTLDMEQILELTKLKALVAETMCAQRVLAGQRGHGLKDHY